MKINSTSHWEEWFHLSPQHVLSFKRPSNTDIYMLLVSVKSVTTYSDGF
jgi:hypothetical protein